MCLKILPTLIGFTLYTFYYDILIDIMIFRNKRSNFTYRYYKLYCFMV